jgi:hypothetical protein
VARIVDYFYEDFINGKIENDMNYYWSVLYTEEEIQRVEQKFHSNIGFLILENEQNARNLYLMWKSRKKVIKQSPQRDFLYIQLEKRFTGTFTK